MEILNVGLSNKTEDPTHPAKPTRHEPSVVRPDYLVVGGRFLPSQTNSGMSSGDSSLLKPYQPDSTMIYNLQCLGFSVLSFFLSLKALSHSLNLSTSLICANPHWYLNIVELSTSIIADLHRALDLHHRQSALISQPPSSPICDSLPFTIVVLQSLSFTISNLQVKVVVFINFLFISLFQSHVSLVSICILWIYGLLVFGFVDLFFSVDLFFQICEICGLWSLSFGWNWIRPLCTQA